MNQIIYQNWENYKINKLYKCFNNFVFEYFYNFFIYCINNFLFCSVFGQYFNGFWNLINDEIINKISWLRKW